MEFAHLGGPVAYRWQR